MPSSGEWGPPNDQSGAELRPLRVLSEPSIDPVASIDPVMPIRSLTGETLSFDDFPINDRQNGSTDILRGLFALTPREVGERPSGESRLNGEAQTWPLIKSWPLAKLGH